MSPLWGRELESANQGSCRRESRGNAVEYVLDLLALCNCLDTATEKGAQAFASRLSNTSAAFPNVCVHFGASSSEA